MRVFVPALICACLGLWGCGPETGGEGHPRWPPLAIESTLVDLVEALDLGDDRLRVDSSPVERPLAAYPRRLLAPSEAGNVQLASDADAPVIRAAAGAAFSLRLQSVPPGARVLARTVVLSGHRKEPELADPWPVRFRIRANDAVLAELSSEYVREVGGATVYDQILRTLDLDLTRFEGQALTLHFEVVPGPTLPPPDAQVPETGWWELRLLHETEQPRQATRSDAPNVLVLCVDTLAAGQMSLLGHGHDTTPRLRALAERGTLYTQAWAASSWTMPSTASMFTGLAPNTHGVLGDDRSYLMEGLTTWAEVLRARGIEGAAFVGNPLLTAGNNFDQGFGHYENLPQVDDHKVDAPELHARFLSWLDTQPSGARWFAYVHTMDPHAPYGAPGDARDRFVPAGAEPEADIDGLLPARLQTGAQPPLSDADQQLVRARYEGEVAYADAALGELIDALSARGVLDDTLVILTADHGEELFEHGKLGHGYALSEVMLHVPLLMLGPGVPAGRRLEEPVSTASLAATIMRVGGVDTRDPQLAPSLFPLDSAPRQDTLFALTRTQLFGEPRVLAAARDGDRKVVLELGDGNSVERSWYYALDTDPGEFTPFSQSSRTLPGEERAVEAWSALETRCAEWARDTAAARPAESQLLGPEQRSEMEDALRQLGYPGSDDG
ncbi:MAG: hypothetical protein DHS20C15_08970 [Planctomycetota bacterium]|nr:MAG: hypothetical protein DHS20C15_08970 [Planctomycetota bacterium]